MVTDDDSAWMDNFLGELESAPQERFPDWEDAADLARLHMQAFARDLVGGFELSGSRGSLKLTGGGVTGHAVSLSDVGVILAGFQTLVTSAGASKEGIKHPRGKVPADVVAKTRLLLSAEPSAGSVVLDIVPAASEAEERYPEGQALTEDITPLIEDGIDIAFQVLELAGERDVGELVETKFTQWGPRVASAARELADAAVKADIDLNAAWEKPSAGRRRVRATSAQLATLRAVLASRGLDSPEEVLEGILRTVSDRRKIELEVRDWDASDEDDGALLQDSDPSIDNTVRVVPINRGVVSFTGFGVGDRVKIVAKVRLMHRPGNVDSNEYTATAIQRVGKPVLPNS